MTPKTLRIRRSDGTWLEAKVPKGVNVEMVKRAFAQLAAGTIPFWVTAAEREFIASVIGSFEEHDKGLARVEERDSGSAGAPEPSSVAGGPGEECTRERCEPSGATGFGALPDCRVPATEEAPCRAASTAAAGTSDKETPS